RRFIFLAVVEDVPLDTQRLLPIVEPVQLATEFALLTQEAQGRVRFPPCPMDQRLVEQGRREIGPQIRRPADLLGLAVQRQGRLEILAGVKEVAPLDQAVAQVIRLVQAAAQLRLLAATGEGRIELASLRAEIGEFGQRSAQRSAYAEHAANPFALQQ